MTGWFVTGTDTGVGKTRVSAGLLGALAADGRSVAGMKPVASGSRPTAHGLRNDDAESLLAASTVTADYAEVNPYAFEPPIAPHLAAAQAGVDIDLEVIAAGFRRLAARADCVVVEGVGGWLVPLGPHATTADLAHRLGLPVVMVVGLRLGCLNHALLTAAAIRARGLRLAAWVANTLDDDFSFLPENVASLEARLDAPLLAMLPHMPDDVPFPPALFRLDVLNTQQNQ